jgi:hypothetical protein
MIYLYNEKRLQYYKPKLKQILKWLIPIIMVGMLAGYTLSSIAGHPNPIEKMVYKDRLVLLSTPVFNDSVLVETIKRYKIKFPHIVLAQAMHETNHFQSKLFKDNDNLFGFRMAGSRPTTALGLRRNYAYYASWEMSVLDYALYQAAFLRPIKTEAQYLHYLQKYYAKDPQYAVNIKRYLKEAKTKFK